MNVQTPCSQNAASQLCFLHIRQGQGAVSRERGGPAVYEKPTQTLIRTRGDREKKRINADQEVAELFITSALLSICSCHLVLL